LASLFAAVSLIAGWSLWAAEPQRTTITRVAADIPPASTSDNPDELTATLRRLDVQSAELSLRLYELDLQKIDDINKQMAGLYSNAEVDRFRANVEMAKQRVKAARERADGKRGTAIVGVGQTLLQTAQDTYERDMAANRQLSTAIKPVDVERDRVSVEMAKVNLAKAKLVDQLDSPIAVVNWELDVLRDEVRQLRWRITAITSRR
jgi:outer membrane murein-binding lipoprotein Lpp